MNVAGWKLVLLLISFLLRGVIFDVHDLHSVQKPASAGLPVVMADP